MKNILINLSVIFYLTGVAVHAQSLGDLAREEQKRREAVPAERTTTIYFTPSAVLNEEASTDGGENEDAEENGEKSAKETVLNEITDLRGNNESYWRNAMSEARSRVRQLEDEEKDLASKRNELQLQFIRTGARPAPLMGEIDKTIEAQELNKKNLGQARKELQSLRDEARSSGALPGWLD